jgi:amino acid transporter
MAAKKFGTFGGVFTPSILTILGVIMYMRLGWVVGNAGLVGAILLIVVAHVISVTTGLSISSIATDKKVGAGGVYYVLSRSLGLPMGGAIGVTLWVATALSIALYLVGFAESFNAFVGLDTSINGLRIAGSIALAALAAIAIISTAVAIKTQYFIMGAIALSLLSIFAGTWEFAPQEVPNFGPPEGISMMAIFAILFPAVTGFTAGIAMSGDLQDPKKSIPRGTIASIAVGFIVYTVLAIFMAYAIDPEMLRSDYNVLMKIALFAPAVVAGIWGATLSSALGGILGGPRILQAMSIDRITPKLFSKGVGKDKEPRNALLITLVIAECGVLIGELDMIAEVCSMFYLAAYGFINLAFFLESWASADFSPSFKVKRWIGLIGFIATFAVMFQLNAGAMVAAFIVIGGIYAYLQRKQLALSSGDIWTSVWSSLVMKGLMKMDMKTDSSRNWKPNILLFSGGTENRPHLIEMSKAIAGKVGMVSNFDLIENPEAEVLFPKHEQSVKDPVLIEHGIFGRKQEVQNVFKGIEIIASTYGFSGVEPNTVLLGWAKNTADPLWFAQMTQKLMALDYNVLYLDYDWDKKFGKYQRIDIWWRNLKNNAELTLNLVKFISQSPQWSHADIRVILINDTSKEGFERRIHKMLDSYRIDATIKVIDNHIVQKSSYELMKSVSKDADLILAGIPDIPEGEEIEFVEKTTEMFESIATTLLVKTSSMLGEDVQQRTEDLAEVIDIVEHTLPVKLIPLPKLSDTEAQHAFAPFSESVDATIHDVTTDELSSFQNIYEGFVNDCRKSALLRLSDESDQTVKEVQVALLEAYQERIEVFQTEDIPYLEERLVQANRKLSDLAFNTPILVPKKLRVDGKKRSLRKIVNSCFDQEYLDVIKAINYLIGRSGVSLSECLKEGLVQSERVLSQADEDSEEKTRRVHESFDKLMSTVQVHCEGLKVKVRNIGRNFVVHTAESIVPSDKDQLQKVKRYSKKDRKALLEESDTYPEYWHRNADLLNSKLSTDIKMHRIQLILEQIGDQLSEEIDQAMFSEATARFDSVDAWINVMERDGLYNASDLPEVNQTLSYDEIKIQGLMSVAIAAGEVLPEHLKLMDPESLGQFAEHQGESVESIDIDSLGSYKHLLQNAFQTPVQKHLVKAYQCNMEALSKMQFDLNQVAQRIAQAKELPRADEIRAYAIELKPILATLKSDLFAQKAGLGESLAEIVQTANSSMNTSALLDHAVHLLPSSGVQERRKGLSKWLGTTSEKASAIMDKYGELMVSNTGQSSISASQAGSPIADAHYSLRRFAEELTPSAGISGTIPFYYKQLFIGKQAPNIKQLRHRELEIAQAMHVLEGEKAERSLLVVADPLSGKSFYADSIAKEIGGKNVIKIQAPINGTTSVIDLMRCLKKQGVPGMQARSLYDGAPEGTVFLVDDLELWWDRSSSENKALRAIIALVSDKQIGHRVILTCNSFAFKMMKAQGLLDELTASIVYLRSLNTVELRSLLLERHIAGGLGLAYTNSNTESLSTKEMRKLLDRYAQFSGGNIGIAFHQWISNITAIKDDVVEMRMPKDHSFPALEEKEWLIILSQFILHKHLDAKRIQHLFNYSDVNKADRILRQLHNDGLLDDIMGVTYSLNPVALVWVMQKAEQYGSI